MIKYHCGYDDGPHEYPDDWQFGGANEADPRADPRWRPTKYVYYSDKFEVLAFTQALCCDDEALDYFTKIAKHFPGHNPRYIEVKRPDEEKQMLPWVYNKAEDTVYPRGD